MRVKLELVQAGQVTPIVVTADATATVGDVATAIRSNQTRTPIPSDSSLSLQVVDPHGAPLSLLASRTPLSESGLLSGQRVVVAPSSEWAAPTASTAPARIVFLSGPEAGRTVYLRLGPNVIGRGSDCEITVKDEQVSRRHARITVGDRIEITDLHSTNGVVISDQFISQKVVGPADTVRIGTTTFRVEYLRPSQAPDPRRTSFNRSPLVRAPYAGKTFEAPAPPQPETKRRFPLVAMIAPLLMGVGLYVMTRSPTSIIFVALSPIIALGTYVDSRWTARKSLKGATKRFKEDVSKLKEEITVSLEEERQGRCQEFGSMEQVATSVMVLSPDLWHRHPRGRDFLTLKLGYGPARSRHVLNVPSRGKADSESWEALTTLRDESETVDDVPITAALPEVGNLGVAGPADWRSAAARALVAQLVCLHSPAELTLCAIASSTSAANWEHLLWLPHVGSPHSPIFGHHLASAPGAVSALVSALEELVSARKKVKATLPALVLLVENDAPVERGRLVSLAEDGPQVGVHILWVAPRLEDLPAACHAYVTAGPAGRVTAGFVDEDRTAELNRVDQLSASQALSLARYLSPVQDAGAPVLDQSGIPRSISYLSISGQALAQDPAATVDRWQENGSVGPGGLARPNQAATLRALVGQGTEGALVLDLRAQGPHALVGGTSGAGKSEFLQSWILGMASAHSPRRVTFLFVDYKGGSAFADCVRLPHTVGLVTDLSPHLVRRALTSLRAELQYRERLLNAKNAKDLISLEKRGDPDCPPSLVIVVDEFAALVNEVPEFIDGVVDVAQRGRSLGLHLILATQRPAGVIRGNLRANTALRIALRMADEGDSIDVIDTPVAATFDPRVPGRAAVRTGPGRVSLFQTGYVGGHTVDVEEPTRIEIDTMAFGPFVPWDIPAVDKGLVEEQQGPTDLSRAVDCISAAALQCAIPAPRKPWLPELPTRLDLEDLIRRFGDGTPRGALVFGMADDPAHQSQHPILHDFDEDGNIAVFGAGASGKSAFLRTLAVAGAANALTSRTEVYGFDFASGGLAMLEALPTVGSVIIGSDLERVNRLLKRLVDILEERTLRYSAAHCGSITEYRSAFPTSTDSRILLLVDGFSAFREAVEGSIRNAATYQAFTRLVLEGRAVGIHVALTAERSGALPSSLAAALSTRLVLRLAEEGAYTALNVPKGILTGAKPGRAVLSGGSNEIQIAVPGGDPSPATQAATIDRLARWMREHEVPPAEDVRKLAELVHRHELPDSVSGWPVLGIEEASLEPIGFAPTGALVVAGMPGSGRTSALTSLVQSLQRWRPQRRFYFVGPRRSTIHDLGCWESTASSPEEVKELAALVKESASTPAEDERPDVILVVEALGEIVGTLAEGPLLEAFKTIRRNGHLVVAEQETSSWAAGWPLISEVRNARHGIIMQPNPMDGDVLFKVELPRIKRSEYPLGRGVYVRSGQQWTVQLPLPE